MRVRYSFSSRRTGQTDNYNQHRIPFPKQVRDVVETSDVVLEILDARFIQETRNEKLEKIMIEIGKKIIYVLNKADLINMNNARSKIELENLYPYVFVSCRTRMGAKTLRDRIKIEVSKLKIENARVGIIGYPNTGKSSVINLITGKPAAGVAAESGFTRGIQKVRLTDNIMILDTPGVIPEKYYVMRNAVINQAKIGVRNWFKVKDPDMVVHGLVKMYPEVLEKHYGLKSEGDSEIFLEALGRRMSFLKKGGIVDIDRTARLVLKDWQEGKIKV